ncbi:ATP-grasp domain-containing protein [Halpernia sp. GG3]
MVMQLCLVLMNFLNNNKIKFHEKKYISNRSRSALGQGILRLLQISNFAKKIYTADPDPRSTGHWLGDYAVTIPKATDENYIEAIRKIVTDFKIDAVLVGTDVELPILAKYKEEFTSKYNCKIIVSDETVINIANDKFLTAEFLEKNNFSFPFSVMANDEHKLIEIEDRLGFPLFAKPFDGARSLGIKKISNHKELMEIYDPNSNLVVQQFLPEDEGEFTCGCLVVKGKCVAIVTLKRDLRDGNTYRAYRDSETSKYDEFIIPIAEKLNADGPVNFQFRILDDKPVIFEINGRFSGTTPLRHFFGFNEVEALLKFYLYGENIKKPELENGIVMRVWSDIFVDEDQFKKLNTNGVFRRS